MKISVVIPNYNGENLLKKNLPKVVEAVKGYSGSVEIIVTDDASKDASLQFLNAFSASFIEKNISFIILESPFAANSGFSANVNRGVSIATGEILILLNTDVSPHKDFLEPLLSHFNNQSVFAVGCMDESIEDEKVILRGIGKGNWYRGFLLHSAGDIKDKETLWVSGGSGAFRKSIWEKLGGLEQLYNPFYWEDIDLSFRAQKSGFSIYFEPNSKVVHEHSSGAIKTTYKPGKVQKIVYRNQFFFVWLNITDNTLLLSHLLWLPLHLFHALRDNNKAFLSGFLLALVKLPLVLEKRKKYRKNFTVSDKSILNKFK